MLSVYSFGRQAIPVVTGIIFATIVVAMTAQSQNPQEKYTTIADARWYLTNRAFNIDTVGCAWVSRVDVLDSIELRDDGTFRGRYYPGKTPRPDQYNVSGSITVVTGGRDEGGTAFRVSFHVNCHMVRGPRVDGVAVGGANFEGALRLPSAVRFPTRFDDVPALMAGTFTLMITKTRETGPFPFSAQSN